MLLNMNTPPSPLITTASSRRRFLPRVGQTLAAGALALAATATAQAQYAPPPPTQPFPGFLNQELRAKDPYWANWDFGGSLRMRYEVKENGLGLPPANDFRKQTTATSRNDNSYFSSKLLLRAAYTDKWWSAYLEGRSSSTTGDLRNPNFESDGPVDLHQAYFTLGNHKEFPVSLKAGRQELSYGDERLVGAFAWNNIGRVFDAVKLRWQHERFTAEAFTSKIVLPDGNNFNMPNDYNVFSGFHVATKEIPKQLTEVYFFARNEGIGSSTANPGAFAPFQTASTVSRDIYTIGTRFKSNPGELGNFDYTVEAAYQFGNWKPTVASAREDHEAYAFVANAGYTFPDVFGTPRFALEYAYASGDSDPTDGKHETFDQMYPTGHRHWGYMDFASWQNIHDVRGIFSLKPTPKLSLAVEGHFFWLADTADNFYNKGGVARGGAVAFQAPAAQGTGFGRNPTYSSFVGSELDLVAGYAVNKFTNLEAGYGHFFVGDYIKQTWSGAAFGSADADWFYVQLNVRF
jgi:hypothetical protein